MFYKKAIKQMKIPSTTEKSGWSFVFILKKFFEKANKSLDNFVVI